MDARWASVKGLAVTNCERMPFLSLIYIYMDTKKFNETGVCDSTVIHRYGFTSV